MGKVLPADQSLLVAALEHEYLDNYAKYIFDNLSSRSAWIVSLGYPVRILNNLLK